VISGRINCGDGVVGGKTSCSECSATGRREALGRQVITF